MGDFLNGLKGFIFGVLEQAQKEVEKNKRIVRDKCQNASDYQLINAYNKMEKTSLAYPILVEEMKSRGLLYDDDIYID